MKTGTAAGGPGIKGRPGAGSGAVKCKALGANWRLKWPELRGQVGADDRNERQGGVPRLRVGQEGRAGPRRGEPGESAPVRPRGCCHGGGGPRPKATAVRSDHLRARTCPVALAAQDSDDLEEQFPEDDVEKVWRGGGSTKD